MNSDTSKRAFRLKAFQRQIGQLEKTIGKLDYLSTRLANFRLAAAGIGLVLSLLTVFLIKPIWIAGIVLAASIAAFIGLVSVHHRVNNLSLHYRGWHAIKREEVARMELDWPNVPQQVVATPEGHPFAADIDLPLVHRLMCCAATPQAAQRLYDWLLTKEPELEVIHQRQLAVKELSSHRLFRTRLALYGRLYRDALSQLHHGADVLEWLRLRQEPANFRLLTLFTLGAAIIQMILFVASRLEQVGSEVWLISFVIYAVLFLFQRRRAGNLFREAADLHDMLEKLGHIMIYLETRRFQKDTELNRLCEPLVKAKPSRHLWRLAWLASGASLQGNFVLWFAIHSVMPLDLLVAVGLFREKDTLLRELPAWLEKWYEIDALSSLATYADLNPDYNFPVINSGEPVLQARGMGHPLIARALKVSNDLSMTQVGTIFLITGSNMSGKSTFLRAIGVNISISQAGGPVDAIEYRASPLRLYTSMRITDSIPEGLSYFYAEVKRLRTLLDAVKQHTDHPVCFLIDEIFRGTNNRERLIGSQAYLKALIGQQAIGLIATHDLELASLADKSALLSNYHFEERVEDDRLIFDYRLKAGPSTTTNALLIMRAEGLPVDADPDGGAH